MARLASGSIAEARRPTKGTVESSAAWPADEGPKDWALFGAQRAKRRTQPFIGAIGTLEVGMVAFRQPLAIARIVSAPLIIGSIVGLKLSSGASA